MIRCKNLTKFYGRFKALDKLDMEVGAGEVFGFIGLNGAGKTTTIRLLCGLIRPTAGQVEIQGISLTHRNRSRIQESVGYLPQSANFFDRLSAQELVAFYCKLCGADFHSARKHLLEMEVPVRRRVDKLSPGQQRKVQIVIATLGQPSVLLLDEPTAGLDPKGVGEIKEIIRQLHNSRSTILVSSHILGDVEDVCTSIGIIHKGKLLHAGKIGEVVEFRVKEMPREVLLKLRSIHKDRLSYRDGILLVNGTVDDTDISAINNFLASSGVEVLSIGHQSLEDQFSHLLAQSQDSNEAV